MRIFLSTGELSGDAHAAHLVHALRAAADARGGALEFAALGSEALRAAGVDVWEDTHTWAGIGLLDSIRVGPRVAAGFRRLRPRLATWHPDLVIAVDYRVFNLRLLTWARHLGTRTAYYFPPVQWGSTTAKARQAMVKLVEGDGRRRKPDRFDLVANVTDLVLLTYPLSEAAYRRAGANVHYIGHPLWNALQAGLTRDRATVRQDYGDPPLLVGLFPGSREQELRDIWPVLRQFLATCGAAWPEATWLVSWAHPEYRRRLERDIASLPAAVRARVRLIEGMDPNVLRAMDLVLMKSGTGAQTALLLGVPMVTFYNIGMPPLLGPLILSASRQLFLNLPYYAFPNLLAGRQVVPELIQEAYTLPGLIAAVEPLLNDPAARAAQVAELEALQAQLVRPDALTRAAHLCLELLAPETP